MWPSSPELQGVTKASEAAIFCWSCRGRLFTQEVYPQTENIVLVLANAPAEQTAMRDGKELVMPRRDAVLPHAWVRRNDGDGLERNRRGKGSGKVSERRCA